MRKFQTSLLTLSLLGVFATAASAQSSTAKKPVAKTTTTTAKPAAKPTPKPAAVTAKPAPAPAPAPAPTPAPAPAPAPAPRNSSSSSSMGSNGSFRKGSTAANLGIGLIHFGSYSGLLFSGSNYSRTPLINLSVEHGIIDNVGPGVISVGGIVGFRRASYTYDGIYSYGYKWSATDIFVGARGIYHYQLSSNPKLDTYGGLTVGVRVSKYSYKWDDDYPDDLRSSSNSYTNVFSGLFVGARYNFAENIGVFGEFGYDIALIKLGLSAKF